MFCQICLWNEAYTIFNCEEYSLPPVNSELYRISKYTGYNHVINSNSYNDIFVCDDCLISKVYNCDIELKQKVLEELKFYFQNRF